MEQAVRVVRKIL